MHEISSDLDMRKAAAFLLLAQREPSPPSPVRGEWGLALCDVVVVVVVVGPTFFSYHSKIALWVRCKPRRRHHLGFPLVRYFKETVRKRKETVRKR